MAAQVLSDAKVLLGGYDMSGSMNAATLALSAELADTTAFADAARTRIGGLKDVSAELEGIWQGGDGNVDDVLFDNLGTDGLVMGLSPNDGSEGDLAYFFKCIAASYVPGAEIGALLQFSVSAEGQSELVRGVFLANKTGISASSAAAAQNVGAVASDAKLYASLHVLSVSGTAPTLDVTIESDATNTFAGGETTRITFNQASAIGSQWATPIDGAITDGWWRAAYTLGGTSPSFDFIVLLGIQ